MTAVVSGWTEPGVVIAGIGVIGGFVVWAWRYISGWPPFNHGSRLRALEASAASKQAMDTLGAELRGLHKEHVDADAMAFKAVNDEIRHVRENMAQRDDLKRVEDNLTEILMDGFKKVGRS